MNPHLLSHPGSDPAQILRYRDRQYAAELLAAAILHLDLFTWIGRNPGADSAALCNQFGLAARPADVLLTLARANGLVSTDVGGGNRLMPVAEEHLVSGSPWFLGPYYSPIQDTPIVQGFLRVLRTGKPANWQAKDDGSDWHASMMSEDFARHFTRLMNCRGLALSQVLARALTPWLKDRTSLLDIGGGSGIYSSTLAAVHPHLRATVLEQAPVDQIAAQEIEQHGLADRVKVVTANMFLDPWPSADVVLLSNVLHDWDAPEVRQILTRASAALRPHGLLVIHDAFIDDDKAGPLPVAEYSALLMNITQGKCYSSAEYCRMLCEVGLVPGTFHPTLADRGFLTAERIGA